MGAKLANKKIFVLCEYKKNQNVFYDVSFELLSAANSLSKQAKEEFNLDYEVYAIVLDSGIDADFCQLSKYGAQKIIYLKNEKFSHYDCCYYSSALVELFWEQKPDIVLFGATNIGRELAPLVTSKLQTGLTADCTALSLVENKGEIKLAATRPTFGGVLMATILCKNSPQCATVREGVFKKVEFNYDTITIEVAFKEDIFKSSPLKLLEFIPSYAPAGGFENAKIILCGGKGLKSRENFEKLEKLAKLTGCAVAASRGAVDKGFAPQEIQVGQTGKTVAPQVYVAFGVSGAIHHISGMSASKTVVAVNNDPNAPIFENCDYKIVADAVEIIDKLLEKFDN